MKRGWVVISALLLSLAAYVAGDLYQSRQSTARHEQARLTSLAKALEVNLITQVHASSRMLDGLRQSVRLMRDQHDGTKQVSQKMEEFSNAFPGVRSFLWVNADGKVLASNRSGLIGNDFKGSERYERIKAGNRPNLIYIAPPFKTPMGVFTISLGKVIQDRAGRFDGYVLAILDPDYFAPLMRSLVYADDMRMSLVHGDGKVIYSTQTTPDLRGFDLGAVPESLFNRHMKSGQPTSFMVDRTATTGDIRFIANRTISALELGSDKPLLVASNRAATAVYADWNRAAIRQSALFLVLVVVLVFGHAVYLRRQRAHRDLELENARIQESTEKQLSTADTLFQSYFGNMAVGVGQLDSDGKYQLVNERYCQMIGYRREELIGKMSPIDLTHPDDREAEAEQMTRFLSPRSRGLNLEKRMLRKDGQIVWVHVTATTVREPDGKIKFITAIIEDITARRATAEQLLNQERRLRVATETAHVGIFDWNIKTNAVYWSPEMERIYGVRHRPNGRYTYADWEQALHPDDLPMAIETAQQAIATGKPVAKEWRLKLPDGQIRWVAASFQAFYDLEGKPEMVFGANIDVTHQKALEEALSRQADTHSAQQLDGTT